MPPEPLSFMVPGRIGRLALRNRLVRAATSETMATPEGAATDDLVKLYGDLARGGAGLAITGHIYVEPCGQYEPRQLGLDRDERIEPLRRVTEAVHRESGRIFAELSHAGSQTIMSHVQAIAPSLVPNAMWARPPRPMEERDIGRVVAAFAAAARRARAAGFDGVHLHGGNGYLISQFNSPFANRRQDGWGGDAEGRSRFMLAVTQAVRVAVGGDFPVTARLGLADTVEGGLPLEEGLDIAARLAAAGIDALEVTYGVMRSYLQNIRPYVGVTPARALRDGVLPPLFGRSAPEAYYRGFAKAAKARVPVPVILVGGLRSTAVLDEIVRGGDADFLALARPFVREPDLAAKIAHGRRGPVACVSCNLCLKHEGIDALRCWRTPRGLLQHARQWYLEGRRTPEA